MAAFVVDTSVIVEYFISSDHTESAQSFFRQLDTDDQIYVPEFCLLECTNVLWKQVRFAGIEPSAAETILDGLSMLRLVQVPMQRYLKHALQIAINNSLAVYDSAYISLAQHFDCPLVTLDIKQGRAPQTLKALH